MNITIVTVVTIILFLFIRFVVEIEFECEFYRFMENYKIEIKLKSYIQSGQWTVEGKEQLLDRYKCYVTHTQRSVKMYKSVIIKYAKVFFLS